jgi:hypothetical protein
VVLRPRAMRYRYSATNATFSDFAPQHHCKVTPCFLRELLAPGCLSPGSWRAGHTTGPRRLPEHLIFFLPRPAFGGPQCASTDCISFLRVPLLTTIRPHLSCHDASGWDRVTWEATVTLPPVRRDRCLPLPAREAPLETRVFFLLAENYSAT